MKKLFWHACIILPAAIAVLFPGSALSDVVMYPEIYKLVQNGQDVEITIAHDDRGFAGPLTLMAGNDDKEWTVFEEHNLNPDELVRTDEYCDEAYPYDAGLDACAEPPEDCDNDGKDECCGWCVTEYYYEIVDECVEPGQVEYELSDYDELLDCRTISVQDTGDECLNKGGDGDADTDSDVDADSDTDTDSDNDADSDSDTDTSVDAGNDDDNDEKTEDKSGSGGCGVSTYRMSMPDGSGFCLLKIYTVLFI